MPITPLTPQQTTTAALQIFEWCRFGQYPLVDEQSPQYNTLKDAAIVDVVAGINSIKDDLEPALNAALAALPGTYNETQKRLLLCQYLSDLVRNL